jgi:hypothetical protein
MAIVSSRVAGVVGGLSVQEIILLFDGMSKENALSAA